ncbi:MAG TPA: carboxypeptidase-like regulatory domain-containing protein [Vicinamibacterales bacterium]|nr:carboxypeptidase-like regulatory domain-containing protein [Vicinamibacterales bacterium]
MIRRVIVIALVVFLLCTASAAQAQQGTSDLRGKVVDQQGAVLPGVSIVVRHQDSGLFRETTSGPDGTFLMSAMTPGVYEVAGELQGFKKHAQRDVRLEVGRSAQVLITLNVGGLTESVTVSAEAPLVDTTSKEIGGNISAQEFVDTPSFNRNFAGYLGMLPGVVATISATTFGADSISVAGQNVRNVNYTRMGRTTTTRSTAVMAGPRRECRLKRCKNFSCSRASSMPSMDWHRAASSTRCPKRGRISITAARFCFFKTRKWPPMNTSRVGTGYLKPKRSSSSGEGRSAALSSKTRRTISPASNGSFSMPG